MATTMREIYRQLQPFGAVLNVWNKDSESIEQVRLLETGCTASADHSRLLVGYAGQLQGLTVEPGANLLLIAQSGSPETEDDREILANVIWMPSGQSLEAVFNLVQDTLGRPPGYMEYAATFLEYIGCERGLEDMVDTASRLFARPVVLVDSGFKILASSSSHPIELPDINKVVELGYLDWEFVNDLRDRKLLQKAAASDGPFIVHSWLNEGTDRIACKVEDNGRLLAYIVVLSNGGIFTQEEMDLAAVFSKAVAAHLRKGSYGGNTENLIHENFLLDLIEGKIVREEVAQERALTFGFQIGPGLCVGCIDLFRHKADLYMNDYLRQALETLFAGSRTLMVQRRLVLIMDTRNRPGLSPDQERQLNDFLERNDLHAGISRSFHGLTGLAEHYRQASDALELAGRIGYAGRLACFDDFKFYQLLQKAARNEDLKNYCHPGVLALMEQDSDHNGRLADTLWAYLDCDSNLIMAAQALKIHRNTMSYRLARIKDVSGLDLHDGETVFQLQVTRRILRFLGENEPDPS